MTLTVVKFYSWYHKSLLFRCRIKLTVMQSNKSKKKTAEERIGPAPDVNI